MFDNDFGYFGSGLNGYVHYMQSFNSNFSKDNCSGSKNTFSQNNSLSQNNSKTDRENEQIIYNNALTIIEYLKKEIIALRNAVSSNLSFNFNTKEGQNELNKMFDLLNEAVSFFKLFNGYSKNPSIVAKHNEDIGKFFDYFSNRHMKICKSNIRYLNNYWNFANSKSFEENVRETKEKYAHKLKIIDEFIADNF